jgi:hypothetical protein
MSALGADQVDPFVALEATTIAAAAGSEDDVHVAMTELIEREPFVGLAGLPPELNDQVERATEAALPALLLAEQWDAALGATLAAGGSLAADVIAAAPPERQALLGDVAAAWSGDEAARTRVDAASSGNPRDARTVGWSWLLAVRACDGAEADRWWTIALIGSGSVLAVPIAMSADSMGEGMRPLRYPQAVWGPELPIPPYVRGTWTYGLGTPDCGSMP